MLSVNCWPGVYNAVRVQEGPRCARGLSKTIQLISIRQMALILWHCHDVSSAELRKAESVCLQCSKFELLSRQTRRLKLPQSL